MSLEAGEVFAGYTVVRLLGAGGMGEVYLAKHPRLPRQDALKALPADVSSDSDFRARFEREADLAATLWHPHIVGVHDRGEDDGRLWIAMDYVDGTDAARLLKDNHPDGMPRADVIEIVTAVAEALDYAHERDLLHRDVKPANILLTEPAHGKRRILLADFGIARHADDASLTATSMTVGSVAYAAPEQLMAEILGPQADQYALAATAHHLLTGAPPFSHANAAVVISRHLNSEPPPVSATHPDLADLDAVLCKALAKDPADRYATCLEFASALAEGGATTDGPTTFMAKAETATTTTATESVVATPTEESLPPTFVSTWREEPQPETPIAAPPFVEAPAPPEPPSHSSGHPAALVAVVVFGILLVAWLTYAVMETMTSSGPVLSPDRPSTPPQTSLALPPPATKTTTRTVVQTSTATFTSPVAPPVPVAVVGKYCNPGSTPVVDLEGVTVYCAQIQSTDAFVWSRIPGTLPLRFTATGIVKEDSDPVHICARQTGWSLAHCAEAQAGSNYRGDAQPRR